MTPKNSTQTTVLAETPIGTPPAWAIMQRRLFDVMDEGWWLFRERYCLPDGGLRYAGPMQSRDGADDFYEAFVNWPVLYQLGGADDLTEPGLDLWAKGGRPPLRRKVSASGPRVL